MILMILIISFFLQHFQCPRPNKRNGVLYNNFLTNDNNENDSSLRRSNSVNPKSSNNIQKEQSSIDNNNQNVKFKVKYYLPSKKKFFFDYIVGLVSSLIKLNKYELMDKLHLVIKTGQEENQCSINYLFITYETGLKEDNLEEYQKINPELPENKDPISFLINCRNAKKEAKQKLNEIEDQEKHAKTQIGVYKTIINNKFHQIKEKYESLNKLMDKKLEKQTKSVKSKGSIVTKIQNALGMGKNKKDSQKKGGPKGELTSQEKNEKDLLQITNNNDDIIRLKKEIEEASAVYDKLEEVISQDNSKKREIVKKKIKKLAEINCPLYCANPLKGLTINGLIEGIGNFIDFFKTLFHCLNKDKEIQKRLNEIKINNSENFAQKLINFLEEESIENLFIKVTKNAIEAINHPIAIAGSIINLIVSKYSKNERKQNFYKGRLAGFLFLYVLKMKEFDLKETPKNSNS